MSQQFPACETDKKAAENAARHTGVTRWSALLALLVALGMTTGCMEPARPPRREAADQPLVILEEIDDGLVPMANAPGARSTVRTPQTGSVVYSENGAAIDASNTSNGYILCKYSGSGKIKLQITRSGGRTYTYNLSTSGNYEVFPLSSGNGTYSVMIYKNVSGNQYAQVMAKNIQVELSSSTIPFLYPNQYVNYSAQSQTVKKGESLAESAANDLAVVANVYNHVVNNISYDTQKAATVQSGYLPNVDSILSSGKGICFDYAAVMAAMLRTQNIPARLEVGYVSGGAYHAWLSVYISEVGWVNDAIYFDGSSWKLMDPTFASSGGQSSSIMQYIGNGSNYSVQYMY